MAGVGVTASAIAWQLGMGDDIKAITGPELELLDEAAMLAMLPSVTP